MENEIKKNWNFLKGIIQVAEKENKNPCHPYLTLEEKELFEQKMRMAIREKKLKRINKKTKT